MDYLHDSVISKSIALGLSICVVHWKQLEGEVIMDRLFYPLNCFAYLMRLLSMSPHLYR